MWRKPEEAKPSSKEPPKAETATPATASTVPAATEPAGPSEVAAQAAEPPAASTISTSPARPSGDAHSQISSGLKIRGDITGTSDLLIDGDVQGKIQLTGCKLTVGPSGHLKSDVEAREINVFGTVNGNLKASESVALGNTGRVEGSVITRRISIDDGARLRGKVEMIRADTAAPAKAAAAASASASATSQPATISAAKEKA
ncbi:MAG TPA: polymer-forming cytoskeletal protein [Candidatus Acidoferrum sp.]|nr:polymer-forming cytoskeletal protein [Candidatus Acidoferrum sp.]